MVELTSAPFHLDEQGCAWVTDTLRGLSVEEKVGQLFCEMLGEMDAHDPDRLLTGLAPGAVMYRPFAAQRMQEASRVLQSRAKVPLLIASNLERGAGGGNGGLTDGTYFASPMGVAAADDPEHAYRMGLVAARESAAVGVNWSFGPVVDLDLNPDNPITNVRTFGSDPARVTTLAKRYLDAFAENRMATAVKHFPGDGVDFRDQHLLTSNNDLSATDWRATYGAVYRELIDHGTLAVMSAHIRQPALVRERSPEAGEATLLPASLSRELNDGVLREELGFNGVIVTDATLMGGFTSVMPRRRALPTAIASGCDMVLFTINRDEDYGFMLAGVADGTIGADRLDEAVTRILAMKASLGLHVKQAEGTLVPSALDLEVVGHETHAAWVRECADRAVTLVKDRAGLLPITPQRHRRISIIPVDNHIGSPPAEFEHLRRRLEELGHEVNYHSDLERPGADLSLTTFSSSIDLLIYVADVSVRSNQTSVRIVWREPRAADSARYVEEVPTLFLSFSNPYHLVDVPMIKTYVNAYTFTPPTIDAVIEKITGASAFHGKSPVDPFAGLWDARL